MRTLYFDCVGGAAGDMLLGALLDAGASEQRVRADLATLDLPEWTMNVRPVTKGAIRASQVDVDCAPEDDHDRTYASIVRLIERSALSDRVKSRSLAAFAALAAAEAEVHGIAMDEVHFHEAGGIDAIVDIVGCAGALDELGAKHVVCSPLPLGRGHIETAHGVLPLPAPAVTAILRGVPITAGPDHETVTPTGAAILVTAADSFGSMPPMELTSVGWGAGHRDTLVPNVVRVLVGRRSHDIAPGGTSIVEANIDDMAPELIPHAIDALIAAGAQDAWAMPVLMKKGRPAFLLSALVADDVRDAVTDVFYRETTTFGLRSYSVSKGELAREWREVRVAGHPVRVKIARRGPVETTRSPEHDDALRVAKATGMPLKDVYQAALEQLARAEMD